MRSSASKAGVFGRDFCGAQRVADFDKTIDTFQKLDSFALDELNPERNGQLNQQELAIRHGPGKSDKQIQAAVTQELANPLAAAAKMAGNLAGGKQGGKLLSKGLDAVKGLVGGKKPGKKGAKKPAGKEAEKSSEGDDKKGTKEGKEPVKTEAKQKSDGSEGDGVKRDDVIRDRDGDVNIYIRRGI